MAIVNKILKIMLKNKVTSRLFVSLKLQALNHPFEFCLDLKSYLA